MSAPAKEALKECIEALLWIEGGDPDGSDICQVCGLVAGSGDEHSEDYDCERALTSLDSLVVLTASSLQEKARAAEGIALKCRRDGEYDLIPFYEGQASALRQLLSGSGRADTEENE